MQYAPSLTVVLATMLSSGIALACAAVRPSAPTLPVPTAQQTASSLPQTTRGFSQSSTSLSAADAGKPLTLDASATGATECRDIDADPAWVAIQHLAGSRLTDDTALCAHRPDCCNIEERLSTTPPSARRVVKLGLRSLENGLCSSRSRAAATEYWLIETRADGRVSMPQLLATAHAATYAPERGAIEGTDRFVWWSQDTCYGRGSGCTPGVWRRWRELALLPTPHTIDDGERTCATTVPFLVSADW
jgi:hypothetical protein